MHFILGANVDNSTTTGMGRQMHGLGGALSQLGHRVDYLFSDSMASPRGRQWSRMEAPLRTAVKALHLANRRNVVPIAILHEPIGWPTALFLRRHVRTVAMVHNCEFKCWDIQVKTRKATGESLSARSRILWPLTELTQTYATLKLASAIFCLSSEDVRYLSERLRIPTARIQRIDNGVERSFMELPFPTAKAERDLLFLGSWLPRKGIRVLVAMLAKLTAAGMTARLTLAGTGESAEVIRSALPVEWRGSTTIIPHVPATELIALYRRHEVFVLPAITEGIPLSLLEAMACGLCPIVSDVGGVSDVVRHGQNGLLVPALDVAALTAATVRVLADPAERQRLARNAHASIQTYDWAYVGRQVEQFCRSRFPERG